MKRTAPRLTTRTATVAKLAVVPVALIASGLLVSQASYSAYSATTTNPTSNWTTGSVALNDDANAALFTATNLKPGSVGEKCIVVTSTGSLASSVKIYGTGAATTKGLASQIGLTVTQGTGGSFGSCTGFSALSTGAGVYTGTVAGFGSTATNFATGLGSWTPTGTANESRTYKLAYTVAPTAPDSTQGGTAALGFTWDAQNS
jgi:hypothetical protein